MLIYASRTGNVKSIVEKIGAVSLRIEKNKEIIAEEPYILLTYTDGLGSIPKIVDDFLEKNYQLCIGVIASGNKNFGMNNFAGSANKINQKYGIPILKKVELRGNKKELNEIKDIYEKNFKKNDIAENKQEYIEEIERTTEPNKIKV